jgi:hypothetical protein
VKVAGGDGLGGRASGRPVVRSVLPEGRAWSTSMSMCASARRTCFARRSGSALLQCRQSCKGRSGRAPVLPPLTTAIAAVSERLVARWARSCRSSPARVKWQVRARRACSRELPDTAHAARPRASARCSRSTGRNDNDSARGTSARLAAGSQPSHTSSAVSRNRRRATAPVRRHDLIDVAGNRLVWWQTYGLSPTSEMLSTP